ncbi:hypothetical protein [Intrasporangium calvum]|uniref:Uncharacterized protein n=1 Tax=Intrasporangium calvum (strain ATCC 23552 / DSM 43043 / JCM 3097 / NBRC 12989 / NCIMB 10167 / NRRL B-3866 / 7 KIP) TaxID=710696 RepID=E6S6V8_INTC7|nr:hypothetical protein [Intrasporangium calvum]ADU46844.1 hypothetical protein Intca_0289 [Intrasporangium calvum DSM 43043]AXG12118.1 hypothetical protein DN585_00490 [Intrasporangium calvum]
MPTISPDAQRVAVQHYGPGQTLELRSAADGAVRWSKTLEDLGDQSPEGPLEDMADGVVWLDASTLAVVGATQWLELDADSGAIEKAHPFPDQLPFITEVRDFGGGRFGVSVEGDQTLVIDRSRPTDGGQRIDGYLFGHPGTGRAVTVVEHKADNTMALTPLRSTRDPRPAGGSVTVDGFAPWVSFTRDGAQLVVCVENRVELRDARTGALRRTFVGHSGSVMQARVAGSARPGLDGRAGRRDRFGELPLGECPGDCQVAATAMSPDGATAYGSVEYIVDMGPGDRGVVVAWDAATGERRATWPTPWPAYSISVTLSGRTALLNGRWGWGLMDLSSGALVW